MVCDDHFFSLLLICAALFVVGLVIVHRDYSFISKQAIRYRAEDTFLPSTSIDVRVFPLLAVGSCKQLIGQKKTTTTTKGRENDIRWQTSSPPPPASFSLCIDLIIPLRISILIKSC